MNVASSESSVEEDNGELDNEIVSNLDAGNNHPQEIKIEEIIQEIPSQRMLKKKLHIFLKDNDEDCLLEEKTYKKMKPNNNSQDQIKEIKGQPKINTFFVKKTS